MEAAAQFLAVRSRSVSETRQRLRRLGYSDAVTGQVIERLDRLGFLDDTAFARAWVESRDRAHPRGETALRQELRRRGVDDEVVRRALLDRAGSSGPPGSARDPRGTGEPTGDGAPDQPREAEREAARRLLARKSTALAREADPRKRRQKAYALLARNGFDPGTCRDESLAFAGAPLGDDEPDHGGDAG
jgi:SOS response regulatory protein OraA/RecX